MPRTFAFLRALNVGNRIVKMDRLRALFEELGLRQVESYIASGNIVFETPDEDIEALEQRLEAHLRASLGYEVATMLRSDAELDAVSRHEAYPQGEMAAALAFHVGFLSKPLTPAALELLPSFENEIDVLRCHGREIYFLCRRKFNESKLSNVKLEKALANRVTFRNLNTVRTLAAKYPPT